MRCCFSTATLVTRTHHSVTLYIYCLSCSFCTHLLSILAAVLTDQHDSVVGVQISVKLETSRLSLILNSVNFTCRIGRSISLKLCFSVHDFVLFCVTLFCCLKFSIVYIQNLPLTFNTVSGVARLASGAHNHNGRP